MIRGTEDIAINEAARLIERSKSAVFFTGAGISTPSGIPDFRGMNGLWTKENPMEVASLSIFHKQPERFYNWLRPLAKASYKAKPNAAHAAIRQIEKHANVTSVITQNIDHLHSTAGSLNVIELHGSIVTASCSSCSQSISGKDYLPGFIKTGTIPKCSRCGGIIKPGIVLFEEMLPQEAWELADNLTRKCDLMIVVGSSLEVVPAASIPSNAVQNGSKLIILNSSPTHLDRYAQVLHRDDVSISLPKIAERIQ